jgi:hypothetical protein
MLVAAPVVAAGLQPTLLLLVAMFLHQHLY